MLIDAHVYTLPSGAKGFDINRALSASLAAAFAQASYSFVLRYVRREAHNDYDLTSAEAQAILDAGLALMPVQHVAPEGWRPTETLGITYGTTAATHAHEIGLSEGCNLWLDLEGVAVDVPSDDVIAYCNAWHSAVACEGYVPGLYVGYRPGLTGSLLYRALRFTHYWGAYNRDVVPAVRGYQMQQRARGVSDLPPGYTLAQLAFDVNIVQLDALRGLPIVLASGLSMRSQSARKGYE